MVIYEFGHKGNDHFVRNKFGSLDQVRAWAKNVGNKDVYSSVFGYEDRLTESCNVFAGLYFDLDNEILPKAYEDLRALLKLLDSQGVRNTDFNICFSGNKGFHLYIHPSALQIKPAKDLPEVYRKIAEDVAAYLPNKCLDFKVYERRRLWRIANSLHGESGLYKIQLSLPFPTLEEILELAKTPQSINRQVVINPNITLSGWVRRARRELFEKKIVKNIVPSYGDRKIAPQVKELITNGVEKGSRDQTCFYIACYLNAKGFAEEEIRQNLLIFGNNCTPPLSEKIVEQKLRSALKGRSS